MFGIGDRLAGPGRSPATWVLGPATQRNGCAPGRAGSAARERFLASLRFLIRPSGSLHSATLPPSLAWIRRELWRGLAVAAHARRAAEAGRLRLKSAAGKTSLRSSRSGVDRLSAPQARPVPHPLRCSSKRADHAMAAHPYRRQQACGHADQRSGRFARSGPCGALRRSINANGAEEATFSRAQPVAVWAGSPTRQPRWGARARTRASPILEPKTERTERSSPEGGARHASGKSSAPLAGSS